jgi:hypothetical protein
MRLSSIFNLFICIIYLFRLAFKCIDPVNNYCALSIVTNQFDRYILLTFVNYFGNVLKTVSNLIRISFSLDRLVLSTKMNYKILAKFSNTSLKLVIFVFFLLSFILNFVKIFQYDYEIEFYHLKFPLINYNFFNFKYWYAYTNLLHIFINNFMIIFLQIIIDLELLKSLQSSFKEIRSSSITEIEFSKKNKNNSIGKNEAIEKNIKLMIISSGICLFILHLPDFIISIFMATFFSKYAAKIYIDTFSDDFSANLFSFILTISSDVIYFLGFSLNTPFYYFFNSLYYKSLRNLFN